MTSRYTGVSRFELFGNTEAAQKLIPKARALLGMWNQLSQSKAKFRNRYIFSDGSKIEGIRVEGMWMARIFAPGGQVCIMLPPGIYFLNTNSHHLGNNGVNLYRLNTELNPIQFEPFLQSDDYEATDGFYIPSFISYPYHYLDTKDPNNIVPYEPVYSHYTLYNNKDVSVSLAYDKYNIDFSNLYTHTTHLSIVQNLANAENSIGAIEIENSLEYKLSSEADIVGNVTVNRFHSPITYKVTIDENVKWDYDVSLGESPSHITLRLHRLAISKCFTHGDISGSVEIANISIDISSFKGIPYNGDPLWLQYMGITQQVYWDTYIDKDADIIRGMFILRQSIIKKEGDPDFDYTYTPMRGSRGNVVRVIELTIDRSSLKDPTDSEVFTYTEIEAQQTFLGNISHTPLAPGEDIYDTFIRNTSKSGNPLTPATTTNSTRDRYKILGVNGAKTLKTETFDINFTLTAGYHKGVRNLFKLRAYGTAPYHEDIFTGVSNQHQPAPLFPTDLMTSYTEITINNLGDYRIIFYDSFGIIIDEQALQNCKLNTEFSYTAERDYNGTAALNTYTKDQENNKDISNAVINNILPAVVDVENRLYSFEHLHVEYDYSYTYTANTIMRNTVTNISSTETISFTLYQKVWYIGQSLGVRELLKGNGSYPTTYSSNVTDNNPQWSPSVQALSPYVPTDIWTEVYNNGGIFENECYDISSVIVGDYVPYQHIKFKIGCLFDTGSGSSALDIIYNALGKTLYVSENKYVTSVSRFAAVTSEVVGHFNVPYYELSFTGDVMLNQVAKTYDTQSVTIVSVNEDFLITSRSALNLAAYKPGTIQPPGDGIWLKDGWHYIIVQNDLTQLGIIDLDPGADAADPDGFVGQTLSSTHRNVFIGV